MRQLVAYADGSDSARISPSEALAAAGLSGRPEVLLGFTVEDRPWLHDPELTGRTVLGGYALSRAVNDGRLSVVPVRLSGVPALLEHLHPDVAVVAGIRRGDRLVYGRTVGWGPAATRAARMVVVEVDESDGVVDFGAPEIEGNIVAVVSRPVTAATRTDARPADDVDLRIGALVASLLPPEATLQFGPGGIGEGIARAIDRPVGIWSGLVTDAMADLAERGLLRGVVTAGYVWGDEAVQRLAGSGRLRLAPIEVTHDLTALSAIPGFVACNTAVQVGLDGSVNIERVGDRIITSIGGHPDFSAGACRSVGGLSVIALRSTTNKGASAIVRKVEVVSTARSDVSAVVTEHGIADLRGVDDRERARRIADIAAPEHRAALLSS